MESSLKLSILMLVIFSIITPVFALIENGLFRKEVILTNFLCPVATIDLGLHDKITRCASSCLKTEMCRSFFYNTQSKICKGSTEISSTTTGCDIQSGSLYYHTTGTLMC